MDDPLHLKHDLPLIKFLNPLISLKFCDNSSSDLKLQTPISIKLSYLCEK